MGRKKQPEQGKLRTREHVVADLAVNHVERQVLLCNWNVQEIQRDYGIDLILFTYTDKGEVEGGLIFLQVKGCEELTWLQSGSHAAFRLARSDLIAWLNEPTPVILAVYEAAGDRAFWLRVQGYFAALPDFNLFRIGQTITVHVPVEQLLDPAAVRQFRVLRNRAAEQTR